MAGVKTKAPTPPEFYENSPEFEAAFTEVEPEESSALVPIAAPSHHLVVGSARLAEMPEDEYQQKREAMKTGQARMKEIIGDLLVDGEDFGKIKGIDRPFLHQPGAEKLSNFFGFAVRQEADRIVRHEGESTDVPPFAYHVRSYVHLGDFDGPVVAQGFGESNVYEDRYRWRIERPKCEKCGHELRRGGKEGKMAGLWFCPGFDGGCWWSAPVAHFPPGGKIENPDLWGQAETILLMASKRSLVSAVRRATGTSGFFTQDPEAPSVRQQSEAAGGEATVNEPVVAAGPAIKVAAGAKVIPPTDIQLRELTRVTREQDIKTEALAALIERLFGTVVNPPTTGNVIKAVKAMTGVQVGQLIMSATTGEIPPDPVEESRASGIVLEADGMPV